MSNKENVMIITADKLLAQRSFFAPPVELQVVDIKAEDLPAVKSRLLHTYGNVEVSADGESILLADVERATAIILASAGFLDKKRFSFTDLMDIVYRLRDEDGCKWDRAQTHQSIRSNCIEEAYELVDAINNNDIANMTEETGDVLLQGVFHAIIAEQSGEYDIADVMTVLCTKLIMRHTHIFGSVKANNVEEALKAWENAKMKEKGQESAAQRMKDIAGGLPQTLRAYKVQKIARNSNFDWDSIDGAIQKVNEELQELVSAEDNMREEEGGDLLFSVVNLLRHYKVDPEVALGISTLKFIRRFEGVEKAVLTSGRQMTDCSLLELDDIYNMVKSNENR